MELIDFVIGVTLVNSVPHIALGIWKGPMLSAFGFGNLRNILYGCANLMISLGLYSYVYGINKLLENGMMIGGALVPILFLISGRMWRDFAARKTGMKQDVSGDE